MSNQGVTARSQDYSRWYTDVVQKADLADYAPVRGCMIIKPYGYALWENIQAALDFRFKETGHQNAYFPLLIPESFLKKEAEQFEGFAPELAIVTIGGGEELAEQLVIRPTSEAIIGHSFAQWIQSYRDLPMLINQWSNVVRWEMRTRLFLRTLEFLWQEGHTAHATYDDAQEETMRMLDIYADFATNLGAIPVIKGEKSEQEKFPGALRTYTIEAVMGDKKALQSGTSHNLGQNFAKGFDIKYTDRNNELQFCWTTSWGLSTRFIGAIIMAHGDDIGLRMPPRLAPIQVVIVPIFKNDDERAKVMEAAERMFKTLKGASVRVKLDDREGLMPGFKYADWEMRGVPIRMEIGPKDVEKNSVALARRDIPGKEGKQFVAQENALTVVQSLLEDIHHNLLAQATKLRDDAIKPIEEDYAAFCEQVKDGWAYSPFCGCKECEAKVKEDNQLVSRCYPLDQELKPGKWIVCGDPTDRRALFAKAY